METLRNRTSFEATAAPNFSDSSGETPIPDVADIYQQMSCAIGFEYVGYVAGSKSESRATAVRAYIQVAALKLAVNHIKLRFHTRFTQASPSFLRSTYCSRTTLVSCAKD